jgi:hypothetical protein
VKKILDVTQDLTEIQRLHEALLTEAVHKANDHDIPGGLAMVALAPVANLEAWAYRYDAAETQARLGNRATPDTADEDETWEPPLQTLLFWSEQWRIIHDAEIDRRPTVATEAAFIRWALNWAWDNETHWNDFANDIHTARTRLENILRAGSRDLHSEVTCLAEGCGTPLRRRMTGNGFEDEWWCNNCHRHLTAAEYGMAYADAARRELLGD